MIRYGNHVAKKWGTKESRFWLPSVGYRNIYSRSLKRLIRVRVTPRVMKTIDKSGGLDEYLIKNKPARIKDLGMHGWALRWAVMNSEKMRGRMEIEPKLTFVKESIAKARRVEEDVLSRTMIDPAELQEGEEHEEDGQDYDESLEDRVRRRLGDDGFMGEEGPRRSLWQRLRNWFR